MNIIAFSETSSHGFHALELRDDYERILSCSPDRINLIERLLLARIKIKKLALQNKVAQRHPFSQPIDLRFLFPADVGFAIFSAIDQSLGRPVTWAIQLIAFLRGGVMKGGGFGGDSLSESGAGVAMVDSLLVVCV